MCTTIHNTVHAFISQTEAVERPEKLFFTGPGAFYPETAELLGRFLDMPSEPIDVGNNKKVRMDDRIAGDWSPDLMNGALSLTLKNIRKEEGFNLRREEFEPEKRYLGLRKEIPKIAIFLFLILSLLPLLVARERCQGLLQFLCCLLLVGLSALCIVLFQPAGCRFLLVHRVLQMLLCLIRR